MECSRTRKSVRTGYGYAVEAGEEAREEALGASETVTIPFTSGLRRNYKEQQPEARTLS